MDVTKNNFEEALPLVEESIRNCDFIAFDAEFSGKSLCARFSCFNCCVFHGVMSKTTTVVRNNFASRG